jgi:hypothetical protein
MGFSGEHKQSKQEGERERGAYLSITSRQGLHMRSEILAGDAARPVSRSHHHVVCLPAAPPRARERAKCNCFCSHRKLATCTHICTSASRCLPGPGPCAVPLPLALADDRTRRLLRPPPLPFTARCGDRSASSAWREVAIRSPAFCQAPKAQATERSPSSFARFWFRQPWELVSCHMT